jgi:hypothetical protein
MLSLEDKGRGDFVGFLFGKANISPAKHFFVSIKLEVDLKQVLHRNRIAIGKEDDRRATFGYSPV